VNIFYCSAPAFVMKMSQVHMDVDKSWFNEAWMLVLQSVRHKHLLVIPAYVVQSCSSASS